VFVLTNKTGEAYTENPVGRRGDARPEVLVQLRDEFVADGESFNVLEANMTHPRYGEGAKVRRSPQAVACRKRCAQELGKSHELPLQGKPVKGCTVIEARKRKLGNRTRRKTDVTTRKGRWVSTAKLSKGTRARCSWDVLSSIVLSGRESLLQGEGLDGST